MQCIPISAILSVKIYLATVAPMLERPWLCFDWLGFKYLERGQGFKVSRAQCRWRNVNLTYLVLRPARMGTGIFNKCASLSE